MRRLLLLCTIICASITLTRAQEHQDFWCAKVGVNFANFTNLDYTSKYQTGFNVGFLRAFSLSKALPLYIQSGLSFEMKGAQNSGAIEKTTFKSYSLEIPVLINYGVTVNKNFAVHPFVGLYYSFALSGSFEAGGSSENPYTKEEIFLDPPGEVVNSRIFSRSDFGIRAGVDFKYMKYSLGVAYDAGLTNIYAKELRDSNYKASTGCISLNLGYYF